MATLHAILIFHLLFSLTFTATTIATATVSSTTKPRRLVTRLLHHDSLLHNPNDTTISVRAERFLNNYIARFIKFSLFYVNFSIGQPPVPQLAIMDTGSDLIWVNCNHTCNNCGPVFDPSMSTSFAKTLCNYTSCDGCSPTNECKYDMEYANFTDSKGIIATEQFSFETSDKGRTAINNVVFGCGLKNGNFLDKSTGVFGLSIILRRDNFSIVKLLGSRFSYCVGNIYDMRYKFNRLVLGEGTVIEGDLTPFELSNGLYYLTLEGISIGGIRLDIDPKTFKKTSNNNGGVFIDSGTTYTWLAPAAYQQVRREIEDLSSNGLLRRHRQEKKGQLCYYGKIGRDVRGFPVMAFHFAEGADLVLDVLGMFLQVRSDMFCLTIASSDDIFGDSRRRMDHWSIIGMIAQQNYNVAYDLDPEIFEKTSDYDGVFIDSGSASTWLAPAAAYQQVRRVIDNICKGLLTRHQGWRKEQLCYYGKVGRDLQGFPVMTFHFADEAIWFWMFGACSFSIWSGVFCLAMIASKFK
ncbi:hypothetical protein ACOSQ3_012709 [Xanthoceras sorbifolium]